MIVVPRENFIQTKGINVPTQALTKGKKYFVYAIEQRGRAKVYYLVNDIIDMYPQTYDAGLFTIFNDSLPDDWSSYEKGWGPFKSTTTSFPEWIDSLKSGINFYEQLLDAELDDSIDKVFQKYYGVAWRKIQKSDQQQMSLRQYISEWDPMDFIRGLGAPEDEYDAEAREIALRFKPGMNDTEVASLVCDVFVEYMEIGPKDFSLECEGHAPFIRQILESSKDSSKK